MAAKLSSVSDASVRMPAPHSHSRGMQASLICKMGFVIASLSLPLSLRKKEKKITFLRGGVQLKGKTHGKHFRTHMSSIVEIPELWFRGWELIVLDLVLPGHLGNHVLG